MSTDLPSDVVEAFKGLAAKQRGEPEAAMLGIYHHGSGLLPWTAEHVGDLTHRMTILQGYGGSGHPEVHEKVDKTLRTLKSPYGFEKEVEENIASNAQYEGKDPKQHRTDVYDALERYRQTHAVLPVYNRAQYLAREAAVALGNRRYEHAIMHLQGLRDMLDDGSFDDESKKFTRNPDGSLKQYDPKTASIDWRSMFEMEPVPAASDGQEIERTRHHGPAPQRLYHDAHDGFKSNGPPNGVSRRHWDYGDYDWERHPQDMSHIEGGDQSLIDHIYFDHEADNMTEEGWANMPSTGVGSDPQRPEVEVGTHRWMHQYPKWPIMHGNKEVKSLDWKGAILQPFPPEDEEDDLFGPVNVSLVGPSKTVRKASSEEE